MKHDSGEPARNVSLPAVEHKDLDALLGKFGLSESFKAGAIRCASCASQINSSNIGALLVRGGTLIVFCSTVDCMDLAVREGK